MKQTIVYQGCGHAGRRWARPPGTAFGYPVQNYLGGQQTRELTSPCTFGASAKLSNPTNPPIKTILEETWPILGKSKATRPFLDTDLQICYRRNKSLKHLLVSANLKDPPKPLSQSTTPSINLLIPCKRPMCRYCPCLNTSGKFTCHC